VLLDVGEDFVFGEGWVMVGFEVVVEVSTVRWKCELVSGILKDV